MLNLGLMILALAALTAIQHSTLSAQTFSALTGSFSCAVAPAPLCQAWPLDLIRRT